LVDRTPRLTASEKEAVRSQLRLFRSEVDEAKRKDNKKKFSDDVHEYAEAVTRAASDLGRRNARLGILEARLHTALARGPKRPRKQASSQAARHGGLGRNRDYASERPRTDVPSSAAASREYGAGGSWKDDQVPPPFAVK